MNPALPPNFINPLFADLDHAASTEDITFTDETAFLFKCWQSYDAQKNYGRDISVPRCSNLFWRVWSNVNLRSVSNREFNRLWQRCHQETSLGPYRPDSAIWKQLVESCRQASREQPSSLSRSETSPIYSRSPQTIDRASLNNEIIEPSAGGTRDKGLPGSGNTSTRPPFRRSASGRAAPVASRGGRTRPGMARRKSSQGRVTTPRTSDSAVTSPRLHAQDQRGRGITANPQTRVPPTFELASSWQSDDSAEEDKPQPSSMEPSGSLVEPDFRIKFAENQRQLPSGTSLPSSAMRKTRSSVRFADELDDEDEVRKERSGILEGEDGTQRGRSDSQVLVESDESDKAELPRVQSQLSMMIKDRRRKTGSSDLGPGAVQVNEKNAESKKKREELLKMGRTGAAPNIPQSRRSSREEDRRWRSPSPTTTF